MTLKRVIVTSLIGSPSLSLIVLCPKSGIHWVTKMILKTVIPVTLGNLYLYSCTKYIGYKFGLINEAESTWQDGDGDTTDKLQTKKKTE